jgi:glucose-6-phosphate-specific signal transduction histidine kinase
MRLLDLSRFFMSVLLPMLIFPLTFWLQLELGYEVSLFPLYMLPVAALSWAFGVSGIILSVTFATGLWYWGAMVVGHEYQHEWTIYYNAGVRGLVFLMVGVFILIFRRVVEQHRSRMEKMRSLMNVCHACGSVQGSDGRWIPIEALNSVKVEQVCECPACEHKQKMQSVNKT